MNNKNVMEQSLEKHLREVMDDTSTPSTKPDVVVAKEEPEMNMDKDTDNCKVVVEEFAKRGLPKASVNPKEDVFTYKKWQSLGRQVKKGEKGVQIRWLAPMKRKEGDERKGCRLLTRSVFHITQTEEIKKVA
jgi:hypothetical protein